MAIAWAIGGSALLGAATSLFGASQQSDAAQSAAQAQVQAADKTNALNKYIYDQNRADQGPYRGEGTNALYQIGDLLGVARSNGMDQGGTQGGTPQNSDAQTLAQVRSGLQAWSQALPGNAEPIIHMIDSGAPLSAVSSALNSLKATTTNPANTAFLDPLIQQTASAGAGYTVQQPGGGNAFDNSAAGIAGRQQNAFSTFRQDPGYQWSVDQGSRALQNSAAARGVLNSGATAKALTTFGQGLADQQYGNYFSRLQSLAGIGQSATNATQQAGNAFAAGSGQAIGNAGNARASGYIGSANAFAGGLGGFATSANQGIGNYLYNQRYPSGGNGGYDATGGYTANGYGFPNVYITGPQ